MIPWWMAILIFSGGFLPFPSKFNRRCFMGGAARGLKGKPKWKENSVDDGVRIWKQKKEGIENAINQDWKIYSYISFLVRWVVILLFSFDSFFPLFFFFLGLPPISFFSCTRVFKHHTFREPTLFLFLPPPILHTSTAFSIQLAQQCRGKPGKQQ